MFDSLIYTYGLHCITANTITMLSNLAAPLSIMVIRASFAGMNYREVCQRYSQGNMAEILKAEGIEVLYLNDETEYWTNMTFTRDVSLLRDKII